MKKISKIAVGIPLRNTSPAAIEDFLVKKVRSDLGDLTDIATIRPYLRIDSEDGDLSGNITNAYGTVMVTVKEKTLHIPFIISDKELLPFDSIRMGKDEVSYDMSKLRKLVIALEKLEPKELGHNDVMEVVDIRDVPTHNGFLGTIMGIRNNHKSQDINGIQEYHGATFGDMDDERMTKGASANVDIAERFEEFHEKLANVRFFSTEDVDTVISGIQKKAESESQKAIDSVKQVDLDTKESNGVKREIAQLDETNLVDAKRAASGNNVRFPIFDENRFEFRNGRVYHNIEALGEGTKPVGIKRIVLDSKGEYAFLNGSDKFMLSTEAPKVEFDLPTEKGRGFAVGNMYAFEINKSTISVPFTVERSFRSHYRDNGMLISVRERMEEKSDHPIDPLANTIFRDALRCEAALGKSYGDFQLLVLKNSDESFKEINMFSDLREFITERAENGTDASNANFMVNYFHSTHCYTVGENSSAFKFARKIHGNFTRPDGFFKEGPLFQKEAAYEQSNKARLVINEQKKPATYSVEWAFAEEQDMEGTSGYNMQKREVKDLAPAQAKKILGDLGYDARKQEMFFEIAKRNGRYAEFRLPDPKKAAEVAPKDVGANKAKTALTNVVNQTLNSKNFVPAIQEATGGMLAEGVQSLTDRFGKQAEVSYEVATAFEKVANTIRGKEWSEVAYLLNMKHHMDKVACQISEGYVKNADALFEEVSELQPALEKKASLLLEFNRQQLLNVSRPLIEPQLIKQALQQFDELSGYIAAKDVMEKQASFFHKNVLNNVQSIEESVKALRGQQGQLAETLKSAVIDLRTLERKGLNGTPEHADMLESAKQIQAQIMDTANKIGNLKKQQSELTSSVESKNRAGMAAVGIPGLAGLSYGYEAFKNQG